MTGHDSAPPVLVTGAAGFIGYHLSARLLAEGHAVTGLDDLNPYYDPALKRARLDRLANQRRFAFVEGDVADAETLARVFGEHAPARVVHLAAQAGVRHSIENPRAYGRANLDGFLEILEACRAAGVSHLVYASSSSVYGGNAQLPYDAARPADHPVSLYAATKRANELMAHAYAHLYAIPSTGLRFFTVYGPWGRPDMAYYGFTRALFEGRPITLFNEGRMARDFTYIDDVVEAMVRLLPLPPATDPAFDRAAPDPDTSWAPHRVYNIGNRKPEDLRRFLGILEELTGRTADIRLAPMQPGDVERTWADVEPLSRAVGFAPDTPLEDGLARFVAWYRDHHGVA